MKRRSQSDDRGALGLLRENGYFQALLASLGLGTSGRSGRERRGSCECLLFAPIHISPPGLDARFFVDRRSRSEDPSRAQPADAGAIQAATAIAAGATGFATNDPIPRRGGELDVLLIDDIG